MIIHGLRSVLKIEMKINYNEINQNENIISLKLFTINFTELKPETMDGIY